MAPPNSPMTEWNEIAGSKGRFQNIPIEKLSIGSYQRGLVGMKRLKQMAAGWDWALCGVLLIAERDGEFYVMDGQQRLTAAKIRQDIDTMPCIVYKSPGQQWEAGVFWRFNTINRKLNAHDLYKARLDEGDATAVAIDALLRSKSLIASRGESPNCIGFIGNLMRHYQTSPELTTKALDACLYVSERAAHIHTYMFSGFYSIFANKIELDPRRMEKLRRAGVDAIMRSIQNHLVMGSGGTNPTMAANGILAIANRGRKQSERQVLGGHDAT